MPKVFVNQANTTHVHLGNEAGLTDLVVREVLTANENISALTVVQLEGGVAKIAHATDPDQLDRIIGVAATAASSGAEIEIITFGEITDGSWSWSEGGTLFVRDDGSIGSSPGTHRKEIAKAWTPTKIHVDVGKTYRSVS